MGAGRVPASHGPVVFDAYGTLFDPHALTDRLEGAFPGQGSAIH